MTDLAPLWFLDRQVTFYTGPLDYNAPHRHGAPVCLMGLEGSFGLRLPGTQWLTCRSAMIPAGTMHELDVGGRPIGVLYAEGEDGSVFSGLVGTNREVGGALVGTTGDPAPWRELFEKPRASACVGAGLHDLLRFARHQANRRGRLQPTDRRLTQALETLSRVWPGDLEDSAVTEVLPSVARLSLRAGLSPSRFQHLFTSEMGVPFRRYRSWVRMRRAIREVVEGANFTTSAHAAGYADQAHFSHAFRQIFGAPASRSLKGLRF